MKYNAYIFCRDCSGDQDAQGCFGGGDEVVEGSPFDSIDDAVRAAEAEIHEADGAPYDYFIQDEQGRSIKGAELHYAWDRIHYGLDFVREVHHVSIYSFTPSIDFKYEVVDQEVNPLPGYEEIAERFRKEALEYLRPLRPGEALKIEPTDTRGAFRVKITPAYA